MSKQQASVDVLEGDKAVVYKIVNMVNGKCYIGSSSRYEKRRKRHFEDLKYGNHHCKPLQRAANKYGLEKFEIEILEQIEYSSVGDILKVEQFYMDLLKPEYNVCKTAGSQLGSKRSDEFRMKCSERVKGKPAWNKGLTKKQSKSIQEQGAKHSKKMKGRKKPPHSETTRLKISLAHKGRKMSDALKKKLSDAKLKGTANNRPVISVDEIGNITEYIGVGDASRKSGIPTSSIYNSINNRPKKYSWKGKKLLTWKYKPTIG